MKHRYRKLPHIYKKQIDFAHFLEAYVERLMISINYEHYSPEWMFDIIIYFRFHQERLEKYAGDIFILFLESNDDMVWLERSDRRRSPQLTTGDTGIPYEGSMLKR